MKCTKCHAENPEDTNYCGKCSAPLPSAKDFPLSQTETFQTPIKELTTGSTFAGRYQVIEELGHGGMGRVYKVQDTKIGEKIALKLIRPETVLDKTTVERFVNELKLARKIRHRNICQMFDLGEDQGTRYITMEYVHGEDLKRIIRKMGRLSPSQAVGIALQVCDGLTEAHKLGVVHRDLKPQNIMLDEDGNARIMDFGIARSLSGKASTGAGVMIGTPEYMSPEQVEGKDVDQRSDIYSLGVILYEMVTGRVPFEGDTPFTIGVKHKSEIPRDPRELNTQIPQDLGRLVLKCLEKDKSARYQTAAELGTELEKIEKGIPTIDRVVPVLKAGTSRQVTVSFNPRKLVIPAVVLGLIVVTAVLLLVLPSKKTAISASGNKPKLAVLHFRNMTGDPKMDVWKEGLPNLLINDMSQSSTIDVVGEDRIRSCLTRKNLLQTESYTTENLADVSSDTGATHVVNGFLTKAGEELRINISIHAMKTNTALGSEEVKGTGEQSFFAMIDELKTRIKARFEQSGAEPLSKKEFGIGQITTSSPEAFKYYLEGRRFYHRFDWHSCISLMEDAVKIDPGFAMAYRAMSIAHNQIGNKAKSSEFMKKALELSDRLPEREKSIIQFSNFESAEETLSQALEIANKLLKLNPNDVWANSAARSIYSKFEDWEKVIYLGEVCLKEKSDYIGDYTNLSDAYAKVGRYDKAREAILAYIPIGGDSALIHAYLASSYTFEGKYDLALAEADKAIALNPTSYSKGTIWFLQGEWDKAEKECQRYLAMSEAENQLVARYWLEILYRAQGKFRQALEQARLRYDQSKKQSSLDSMAYSQGQIAYNLFQLGEYAQALSETRSWREFVEKNNLLDYTFNVRILAGLIAVAQKDFSTAQKMADENRNMAASRLRTKKWVRFVDLLQGIIEIERGHYAKAVSVIERSLTLWPAQSEIPDNQSWPIYYLGLAHFRAGNMETARQAFEDVTKMTVGREYIAEHYAISFYMLGQVFEKTGDKAKAIENYTKFLDLWKNADAGRPEVEDAKKRLAGLKIP